MPVKHGSAPRPAAGISGPLFSDAPPAIGTILNIIHFKNATLARPKQHASEAWIGSAASSRYLWSPLLWRAPRLSEPLLLSFTSKTLPLPDRNSMPVKHGSAPRPAASISGPLFSDALPCYQQGSADHHYYYSFTLCLGRWVQMYNWEHSPSGQRSLE